MRNVDKGERRIKHPYALSNQNILFEANEYNKRQRQEKTKKKAGGGTKKSLEKTFRLVFMFLVIVKFHSKAKLFCSTKMGGERERNGKH